MILQWDKPKKARSTVEHNATHQSDSGVAGTYVPNMSDEDNKAWKAKRVGDRVEIRRAFSEYGQWAQVLIIVELEGITISANGKIGMTWEIYMQFSAAVAEAHLALGVRKEQTE